MQLYPNSTQINCTDKNFKIITNYFEDSNFDIIEIEFNYFIFERQIGDKAIFSGSVVINQSFIRIETHYFCGNIFVKKWDNNTSLPFQKEYESDITKLKEFNNEIIQKFNNLYDSYIFNITYRRYDNWYNVD
jgi:hypothetical protein